MTGINVLWEEVDGTEEVEQEDWMILFLWKPAILRKFQMKTFSDEEVIRG